MATKKMKVEVDLKKKREPVNKKLLKKITGGIFLSSLLSYVLYSLINPYELYSYNYFLNDYKTHEYAERGNFNYGPYTFNIKYEITEIEEKQRDCDKEYKDMLKEGDLKLSFTVISATELAQNIKDSCMSENKKSKDFAEGHDSLHVTVDITNNSRENQNIEDSWFKLFESNGKELGIFNNNGGSVNFEGQNILPDATRGFYHRDITVDKGHQDFYLVISLPNRSSQNIRSQ